VKINMSLEELANLTEEEVFEFIRSGLMSLADFDYWVSAKITASYNDALCDRDGS